MSNTKEFNIADSRKWLKIKRETTHIDFFMTVVLSGSTV